MNKNTLIAVLGISVVVLLVILLIGRNPPPPPVKPDDLTNVVARVEGVPGISVTNAPGGAKTVEPAGPVVSVTTQKSSVNEEDVGRLSDGPQRVTAVFDIKGAGKYSKFCYKSSGNFHYVNSLVATSFVTNRHVYSNGMVEVEEVRKFEKAREMIDLDNVDVELSFERVPLQDIKAWAEIVGRSSGVLCEMSLSAAVISLGAEGTKTVAELCEKLDGKSIRDFFAGHGLKMPVWLERILKTTGEKEAMKRLESVRGRVQRLEGASYSLSYYQSKTGAPMMVTYRRTDGEHLTHEERSVLDSVNVFLDSKIVPDRTKAIGATWTVTASDIEQIVGAATGGRVDGELTLKRIDDNPENGNWQIEVVPKPLYVLNEKGIPSGAIVTEFGGGEMDPDRPCLRAFQFVGKGKLDVSTTRRFLFFKCITQSTGECVFRSSLVSEPLEK